jgi:hypothetical protein
VIFEFEAKLSKKGGIEKSAICCNKFLPNEYKIYQYCGVAKELYFSKLYNNHKITAYIFSCNMQTA